MLEQPQTGLIGRFYRQVENRPKNGNPTRNGRLRGWAVLVLAALDSSTASTRAAQPLDQPFLVQFPVFFQIEIF